MKRWLPWFGLAVVMSTWIVTLRPNGPGLLQDTDTQVLLNALKIRNNPLTWFWGDWPLANHFYRPISTLFFELDLALSGSNPVGYGLTNALLAAACVLLVFWAVFELTGRGFLAGFAAVLFGGFSGHMMVFEWLPGFFLLIGGVGLVLVLGGKRRDWRWLSCGLAYFLACLYVSVMFWPPHGDDLLFRIIGWLPGRTASVMTVFCLVCFGAFARYLRLTTVLPEQGQATSMDLPATKGTVVTNRGRIPTLWLGLAFVGLLLALGSYEQAVMLPGILTGAVILYQFLGRKPGFVWHWLPVIGSWLTLVGYLLFRHSVVPSQVSGYQAQQLRNGPSVPIDIADFVFPAVRAIRDLVLNLDVGVGIFLTSAPWMWIGVVSANVAGLWLAWTDKDRWLILFAQVAALVSYLPMAWLKYFGHYLYWPATFWALYIVLLGQALFRRFWGLVSRPSVQAPSRG